MISTFILLHEKFLQFDWLRVVVFQLNLNYSLLLITRSFKGNQKKFELLGVRVIGSSKKIAGGKEKDSFY